MVAREQEWAFTKEFKVAFIPKKTSIGNMVTNIMLKNMLPCGRSVCATLALKKKLKFVYFTYFALSRKITVLFGWKSPKQNTVTEVKVRDLPKDLSCLKKKN